MINKTKLLYICMMIGASLLTVTDVSAMKGDQFDKEETIVDEMVEVEAEAEFTRSNRYTFGSYPGRSKDPIRSCVDRQMASRKLYTEEEMFSKMTTLFEDCSKRPSGIKGTLELGVKLNTPIPAVSDGIVTKSKREPFCWGWSIEIDHGTNSRKNITTLYCHMFSHKVFVNVGDKVEKGQIIAEVGTNGACIKPSLHLEVRTIESRD